MRLPAVAQAVQRQRVGDLAGDLVTADAVERCQADRGEAVLPRRPVGLLALQDSVVRLRHLEGAHLVGAEFVFLQPKLTLFELKIGLSRFGHVKIFLKAF